MTAPSEPSNQRCVPITANPAFQALLADIRVRARNEEFDQQKFISQDVIEQFRTLGVYRALVPKRFGGDERSPAEFCQMVEDISIADGSAGWVASFGMSPVYLSALPLEILQWLHGRVPDWRGYQPEKRRHARSATPGGDAARKSAYRGNLERRGPGRHWQS